MSVASKNPFALLDDEVSEEVTTSATSAAPQLPADSATPASQTRSNREQKPRGGPASRGGRYYQRGGAKSAAKDTSEQEQESTPRESRRFDGENRGRGRGARGDRGDRGDRGGRGGRGRGGRGREFDRHSGTLPDSEKKVTQGWGANEGNAERNAEEQAAADVDQDTSGWAADVNTGDTPAGDGWGGADDVKPDVQADDAANGAVTESRRPREEEEDNYLTLDEYLAQKASLGVPKLESVRKANDGADDWKDVVPLSKDKEDDNYFIGKTKAPPKARAKKEEKVVIEIDARYERPSRPGRGRGGPPSDRGRGSGGRGRGRGAPRGGPRSGDDASQHAVDVGDQAAFPSLS